MKVALYKYNMRIFFMRKKLFKFVRKNKLIQYEDKTFHWKEG